MDLSDLIDRNAAFTPAKAAIRFAGATLSYAEFARRIVDTARGLKAQLGIDAWRSHCHSCQQSPGLSGPVVCLRATGCHAGSAELALALAEHTYMLADAAVKVLLIEQAFAPVAGAAARGASRSCRSSASISPPSRANRWPR